MGLEASKKEEREPIIVEIVEYDNIKTVLSKMLIPFSDVLGVSSTADVYSEYERIPFEQRDPIYKSIMKQEFYDAMRSFKIQHKALDSIYL